MLKIINYTLLGINYLLVANTIWSIEIGFNALVQHRPLNRYVKDNWKSPLLIIIRQKARDFSHGMNALS